MGRVHPANIERPPSPAPKERHPPGGRSYTVVAGDNWGSLARRLSIDPWTLIRYNYPGLPMDLQKAARQVNWYLEHYLGCTVTTADNRNYGFSPGMKIWLPPAPLTPDQLARKKVLAALRNPVVKRMTFGVGALMISATYYEDIAKLIEAGKILVKANSSMSGYAVYHGGAKPPFIEIPVSPIGDNLIIHECTHAIFDMRKIAGYVGQSEGFGYLAQALFSWLQRGGPPSTRYIVGKDPKDPRSWSSWQIIFDESTRLAGKLSRTRWIDAADAARLFNAIGGANFYRSRVGNWETNDGI